MPRNHLSRLVAVCTSLCIPAGIANAETLRLLSSWPPNDVPSYSQAVNFEKVLEEISDMDVEIIGPDVVPPLEQLEPVSSGVFDILFTHGAYHAGNKGLALALDAIDPDVEKRRSSGVFDFLDQYYQANHNLKLLAITVQSPQGYHCYFRDPVTPDGDWAGRKMRGISTFHGVIEVMGATPVALPIAETYSALEKGVVDGGCSVAAGMVALKHYEVAKYRVLPSFGNNNTIFAMNLDKWNALSDSQREVLEAAAKRVELENIEIGRKIVEDEWAQLDTLGVTSITLDEANATKIADVWDAHQWKLAEQCCGEDGVKFHEIAKAAGLTE